MESVYREQMDLAQSILGEEEVEAGRRHAAKKISEARAILNLARADLNAAGFETTELYEIEQGLGNFDRAMFG
jgi:hypothetical protein